jgi:hypothetical protein
MVALEITCSVLALPIRLIVGHTVDECSGVPGPSEVCIDVLDMYDQPAVQLRQRSRRQEIIANSVQPDPCSVKTHLTVHDGVVRCSFDSIGCESEHSHQVIVRCFDVFVDEYGMAGELTPSTAARRAIPIKQAGGGPHPTTPGA